MSFQSKHVILWASFQLLALWHIEVVKCYLTTCSLCIPGPHWTGFIMLRYLWPALSARSSDSRLHCSQEPQCIFLKMKTWPNHNRPKNRNSFLCVSNQVHDPTQSRYQSFYSLACRTSAFFCFLYLNPFVLMTQSVSVQLALGLTPVLWAQSRKEEKPVDLADSDCRRVFPLQVGFRGRQWS